METSLVIMSNAAKMLAEANTIQKTKELKDLALTAADWAKRKGMGEETIRYCTSYAFEAERKMGELLKETERNKGAAGGGSKDESRGTFLELRDETPTLAELGLTKKESSEAQYLADLPEEVFDRVASGETTVDKVRKEQRNSSVTYRNQPAIQATRGSVPLAGNSHVYTVNKLLWHEDVENHISSLLIGQSLHLCCGKSKLGTVRLDLYENGVDIQADAAHTGLADKSFDTVLCDPPYNGQFQWNHDLLTEMARLARQRIVFQHWFLPCDPDGQYKKANYFKLSAIYIWQPRTYFGRAQIISVFDADPGGYYDVA